MFLLTLLSLLTVGEDGQESAAMDKQAHSQRLAANVFQNAILQQHLKGQETVVDLPTSKRT